MDVVLLGTGSPIPHPENAGPATLVRAGGRTFLVDCGRGVLMRLAACGLHAPQLTSAFLTHLHSDHITDLSDVITTRWIMTVEPSPLPLIGPPRTMAVVKGVLATLAPDIEYRMNHHADLVALPQLSVTEAKDGVVWESDGVTVVAAATDHKPVTPTLGYRFCHEGRSVVIAGDTLPCPSLDELCVGADVLVHTVLRHDALRAAAMPRLHDICNYHSSVAQAAETAARARVGTLVLTHQVPAVGPEDEQAWRDEARQHFDGDIVVGRDLMEIPV